MRTVSADAFRADAKTVLKLLLTLVLGALSLPLSTLPLRALVDQALLRHVAPAVASALLLSLLSATRMLCVNLQGMLAQRLAERLRAAQRRRLARAVSDLPGIAHLEDGDYALRLGLVDGERDRLASCVVTVLAAAGFLLQLIATLMLLTSLGPLVALLAACGFPSVLLLRAANRAEQAAIERAAEPRRRHDHAFELCTTAGPAKEVRVLSLGAELSARARQSWAEIDSIMLKGQVRSAALTAAGWLLLSVAYGAALLLVVRSAVAGQATAGDVALTLALAHQAVGHVGEALGHGTMLGAAMKVADRYQWLLDYTATREPNGTTGGDVTRQTRPDIVLHGVSFRYPGGTASVLHDVNLHLPAGSTVAVVGENGAGKSTLVKLLCQLYIPDRGTITIGGVDLADVRPDDWRPHVSVVFQDYHRFEFQLREAVSIASLPRSAGDTEILDSLLRVGAGDLVGLLPAGLDTQLGRRFERGQELSSGQWQKVAVARALMRNEPRLLVLDEPSANLDPQSEHVLLEQYREAASHLRSSQGGITLLISHRLATARHADLVIVMAGGRIEAVGTHAELMYRGGTYADLFRLQSAGYR